MPPPKDVHLYENQNQIHLTSWYHIKKNNHSHFLWSHGCWHISCFPQTSISELILIHKLTCFHPEMAIFRNLGVNLRNHLCGVLHIHLRVIPWFPWPCRKFLISELETDASAHPRQIKGHFWMGTNSLTNELQTSHRAAFRHLFQW
jgi:hypothetical protein